MAMLIICYLFIWVFFPSSVTLLRALPRPSICGQGVWPALCRGYSLSWQPALCVLQGQAPCLFTSTFNQSSLGALSCLKCPTWEKTEAFHCLSSAQWRQLSFFEEPCLLRVPGSGRNSHPGPEQLGSCPRERHRTHLLVWTGRVCSHHNSCVCLGGPFLALGICCCSIFVLITGVKGNQGLV